MKTNPTQTKRIAGLAQDAGFLLSSYRWQRGNNDLLCFAYSATDAMRYIMGTRREEQWARSDLRLACAAVLETLVMLDPGIADHPAMAKRRGAYIKLWAWNDYVAQSQDEVRMAFFRTAERLRGEAPKPHWLKGAERMQTPKEVAATSWAA